MSVKKLAYADARNNMKSNEYWLWMAHKQSNEQHSEPDSKAAASRIHEGFAKVVPSPLKTLADRRYFTIGSCFARAIEVGLKARGARVLSADLRPFQDAHHLFGPDDLRREIGFFFNRFNVPSMRQEIDLLAKGFPLDKADWLLCKNGSKWVDLNYSTDFSDLDLSFDECIERRAMIFEHMSRALRDANTFILTLGLCEAWFDLESQSYLNITPPARVTAAFPGRFEVHFVDYESNLLEIKSIIDTISQVKRSEDFEIILTVSPVPLGHTFFCDDVIVANGEAKAVLRAVAGEAARRFDNVSYFPSYEIVMQSDSAAAWMLDRLHVHPALRAHIIDSFAALVGLPPPRVARVVDSAPAIAGTPH